MDEYGILEKAKKDRDERIRLKIECISLAINFGKGEASSISQVLEDAKYIMEWIEKEK